MISFPDPLPQILACPDVTDICINGGSSSIFVESRKNGWSQMISPWSGPHAETELKRWTIELLQSLGKAWDSKSPFVDATLPSGHRLHVAMASNVTTSTLISIRNPLSMQVSSAQDPFDRWGKAFEILHLALSQKQTGLICGATGSGKTTLIRDLLSTLPMNERIIILEDTQEIPLFRPSWISLTACPPNPDGFGEISLRTLVKQSLRMRPDRIVLGECRGEEVLDFLQALFTGHAGSLGTLHAHSCRDAIRRLELLTHLGGHALPRTLFLDLMARGIRWIAHLQKTPDQRKISEIFRIEGREGENLLLKSLLN